MGLATSLFRFDDSYARDLEGLYEPSRAAQAPAPELLMLNTALAAELGLDVDALASPEGVGLLVGNAVALGSSPIAMAYAGHQFGSYSSRLGDGRALLLGEIIASDGRRRDVHLKGSGRTSFARGGDGKAAVGPMLREYLISEAMHALGIPTTRALAVLATGEWIARETKLPGAVLVRVASSHLRVGTFQYAAATGDLDLLRRLADYAIARHHPELAAAEQPYLAFYGRVVAVQAALVAEWMHVGFIHGVMNTDNTTISGETIDYGPCAFMDRHDPATVFSSIDQGGRYAYGNQPRILQWNLARLAEALLPLIHADTERAVASATEVLQDFGEQYLAAWRRGIRAKLGITPDTVDAVALADGVPVMLQEQRVDHTLFVRRLSAAVRGDDAPVRSLFADPSAFDAWVPAWRALLPTTGEERSAVAHLMDRANPLTIPRNHAVEHALAAATGGDLQPIHRLLDAITRPFDERPGLEDFTRPAPADGAPYVTFCGT
ncbi:MAG: YdiU family protein [Myxococcales bacterium]|nr:MAG: YdiU family protein [Myxococcales bacterium]